jgi:O-antigen ligase
VSAARRPQRKAPRSTVKAKPAWSVGLLVVWLAMVVPPFLFAADAKESFRLPKLMASEWLALASLLLLAWQVRKAGEVRPGELWRLLAIRALLPLLLVATVSLWTTAHPLHAREALIDLWIGAAALAGWSLALPAPRQEQLLRGLLWPAAALGLLGILQFHGLYQPFQFVGIEYDVRLGVTSLTGNPGDLGAYLVLPCLVAQWMLLCGGRQRLLRSPAAVGAAAALLIGIYALALTQTLAALTALVVGSIVLWMRVLPKRWAAISLGGAAVAALILVLAVAPLRLRVAAKASQALHGDWSSVLTGRLDGWRAAEWMLREHPWAGVGQGAFRPEFVPAKLALLDRGVQFYLQELQPVFANAHNEYLETAADWGLPGLLVLGWALWILIGALRRRAAGPEAALAAAGVTALAVLALGHFPFRIALVAYPALLFLAWVLRPREAGEAGEETG